MSTKVEQTVKLSEPQWSAWQRKVLDRRRRAAVRSLKRKGWPAPQIASHLQLPLDVVQGVGGGA